MKRLLSLVICLLLLSVAQMVCAEGKKGLFGFFRRNEPLTEKEKEFYRFKKESRRRRKKSEKKIKKEAEVENFKRQEEWRVLREKAQNRKFQRLERKRKKKEALLKQKEEAAAKKRELDKRRDAALKIKKKAFNALKFDGVEY